MDKREDTGQREPELIEDLEVSDATAEEVSGGDGKPPSPPVEYLKVPLTNATISST